LLLFSPCSSSTLLGYLGTSIRWDIATLHNGAGTVFVDCCCTSPSLRLCPLYDVAPPRHSSLPSYPWFYDAVCLRLPHHVLLPLVSVSSTCHSYRAVCLYPCMCIPYSISRCSLTLYGALAGHCCSCRSSFIRFFAMLMPAVVCGVSL